MDRLTEVLVWLFDTPAPFEIVRRDCVVFVEQHPEKYEATVCTYEGIPVHVLAAPTIDALLIGLRNLFDERGLLRQGAGSHAH